MGSDSTSFTAVAADLLQNLESSLPKLRRISEAEAARQLTSDKWSAKQVIGHLIDSAANMAWNEIGKRAYEEICGLCWAEWLQMQQQLINHYALNLRDPKAKEFLFRNMEQFLFSGGQVGA